MTLIKKFWKNKEGVSAVETAIRLPLLITLLTAVYDLGQGVVISQKVNTAAHVMGELLTRYETVDDALITDIINAGELSLEPYSTGPLAYDIASVQFDENGDPLTLWRRTFNMTAEEAPIDATIGLGGEGEGVVVVSVTYSYIPFFNNFLIDEFSMYERSFLRGRKSMTVPCTDC